MLILIMVMIGSIPLLSQSIPELGIFVSDKSNYDLSIPDGYNWSEKGTLTNLTVVDGSLSLDNATSGTYLSTTLSNSSCKTLLETFQYEADNIRHSPTSQKREIYVEIETSEDNFSTIKESETYTLETGENFIQLNNFTTARQYIRIRADFITETESSPSLNYVSFTGSEYERENLADKYLNKFLLMIVIGALIMVLVSWATGRTR